MIVRPSSKTITFTRPFSLGGLDEVQPAGPDEIHRSLAEVEADQRAPRDRRMKFEQALVAAPALTWPQAAKKARYLIGLFAATSAGRDPRRQKLIGAVLADLRNLLDESVAEGRHPSDERR